MSATSSKAELFKRRCLRDCGYAARHLWEMNYDEDEKTKEKVRPGGIRAEGPHKEITEFLDYWKEHPFMLLMAPRDSYKSSIAKAFVATQILADPNGTYIYAMKNASMATKKVRDIKRMLEVERVTKYFGKQRGKPWSDSAFNVGTRDPEMPIDNFTLQAVGIREGFNGSHCKGMVIDDPIDQESLRSDNALDEAREFLKCMMPIIEPGGWLLLIGTRWHDLDVFGMVLDDPDIRKHFEVKVFECGMKVVKRDDGREELVGEPTFPHLTKDFLKKNFDIMKAAKFTAQYCNDIISSADAIFERKHFRVIPKWEESMRSHYGYILTDTASSKEKDACYSVIALVSLDWRDHAYLHDIRVGKWLAPSLFINQFFEVYLKWAHLMNIQGAVFEKTALANSIQASIEEELAPRGIRYLNFIEVPRATADSKPDRIAGSQPRFESGRFWVVDEGIPRFFFDGGEKVILWDREGWMDEDNCAWPDGELVREYVYFPKAGKNDIPDTLACLDEKDKMGRRFCRIPPQPGSRPGMVPSVGAGQILAPVLVNGRLHIQDVSGRPAGGGGDWFARKLNQLNSQGPQGLQQALRHRMR